MVQQGDDQEQVEQDGGRGRRGEAVHRVEQAALEGGQRDEHQVGEGDARQLHRQAEMRGIGAETWGYDMQDGGREDLAQDQEDDEGGEQAGEGVLREAHRVFAAFLRDHAGEQRHEGGAEGAFGEQRAEQVRQAEGDEEGVAGGAGAERRRGEDFPNEAQHAADHGVAADGRDAAEQGHANP
jgi:hypothetical protein